MKVGDLVRWSDPKRCYFVGHTGIVLRLESVSNNDGAWIFWFNDEYGPQESWTPLACVEKINDEVGNR